MLLVLLFVASSFSSLLKDNYPVTILVNRMDLQTTRNYAKYYYAEGDDVDVRCFNIHWQKCELWLEHEHAKILREMYKVDWSYYGVGFRASLGVSHNNMVMTCNCKYSLAVKVVFVLQRTFSDIIKVNDIIVRNMKDVRNSYTYYCFDSSVLQIEFNNITRSCNKTQDDSNHLIMKSYCKEVIVNLCNSTYVIIKLYKYWYNDDSPMPYLSLPTNKILLILYTINKDQYIYYGYEDRDMLSLNCSTIKNYNNYTYYMTFGGIEGKQDEVLKINTELSSFNKNKKLECTVHYRSYMWYTRRINVLFSRVTYRRQTVVTGLMDVPTTPIENRSTRMVAAATTAIPSFSGGTWNDSRAFKIALGVGGTVCFLTLISIIIYIIKKRNLKTQRDSNANNDEDEARYKRIQLALPKYAAYYSVQQRLTTQNEQEEPQGNHVYNEPYDHFVQLQSIDSNRI